MSRKEFFNRIFNRIINRIRNHLLYVILLLVITILFFFQFFNLRIPSRDIAGSHLPNAETLKASFKEYNDLWPLWTPYGFSGTPFLVKPVLDYFSLLGVMLVIIPSTVLALKMTYVCLFFLAGISMYFLLAYIGIERKFAFIGALVYLLNGHLAKLLQWGWITTIGGYAVMPLVFLFTMKALKEGEREGEKEKGKKEWLVYSLYSVTAGVLWAVLFRLDPGMKAGLLFGIMFALFLIYNVVVGIGGSADCGVKKGIKKKAVNVGVTSLIILIVFLGLSAQRVLPMKEYLDISARGQTSWKDASSRRLPLGSLFERLLEPVKDIGVRKGSSDKIGLVAFALCSFAVFKKWRNKNVFFFAAMALISVFIANNTFGLYKFLWSLPLFKSMRYMDRSLILFVFSASVLAGIGANELFRRINQRIKANQEMKINEEMKIKEAKKKRKTAYTLYTLLLALLFIDLWLFNAPPYSGNPRNWTSVDEAREKNYVLQNLSRAMNEEGMFRIQTWETRGIDWGTDFWNVPLKLEHIYRYDTLWYPPYMNGYLSVANQEPAKFWGILNVKYITAMSELNVSGFKFANKFKNCEECFPEAENWRKAYGPYLYKNELFLPRAYMVNNSVLVVGEKEAAEQAVYWLMLNKNFKPHNTVIIRGKDGINSYNAEELSRYSAVFLAKGSIEQEPQDSLFKLSQYIKSGGVLFPDITKNRNTITEEDVDSLLSSFEGSLNPIDDKNVIMHNFDKREIRIESLNREKGFLVYSEKFSLFGWSMEADGKKRDILNADAVISAVSLNGDEKSLIFGLSPLSYKIGSAITLITLASLAIFIVIFIFNFVFKANKEERSRNKAGGNEESKEKEKENLE